MSTILDAGGHHITLLGDSILDNKVYTRQGRCVTEHLRSKLESRNCMVTNCAEDGALLDDVGLQLCRIPESSTVLVMSAGGNDGLRQLQNLESDPCIGNLISKIGWIRQEFRSRYAEMLQRALQTDLPLVVCTVYYPNFFRHASFGSWGGCSSWWRAFFLQLVACIGVFCINLVIRAEARRQGLPIIDLAWVFNHAQDYANPIEPSVFGGDKISNNIIDVLDNHALDKRVSSTFWSCSYSATQFPEGSFACPRGEKDALTHEDHVRSRLSKAAQNADFRETHLQSRLPASSTPTIAQEVKRVVRLPDTSSNPEASVARYVSIDPKTGRAWGMPNAGGRGQCLDCPNKAAIPSKRCVRCQLAYTQASEPMAAVDMQRLQDVLDELVLALPMAKREDVATRLQNLKSCLAAGKIQQAIQQKLLGIVDATTTGDRTAAKQEAAWLAAHHWEQHKSWIVALRCLLV
mmetsp:Transcript_42475/g.76326  ORF Transcript_42475/g.76326 Transcript_42475/m.76326 type:complete len:462 (-) Transcript_42475:136-1521(-)